MGTIRPHCFVLKHSSPKSKGLACLRFEGYPGEVYPRDLILSLKQEWYFFWFSSWNYTLKEIPYYDLIDIFVAWDNLAAEIQESGLTNSIVVRGGSETYEPHHLLFYPIVGLDRNIDVLYIARFLQEKRCDIAMGCVKYLFERNPNVKAVFLESFASSPEMRDWVFRERRRLGLERNLVVGRVPLRNVNTILNRARLSLFTSDEEGMCRAVLQSLLAERPLLCYRNTRSLIRLLYDNRFFNFYDIQTAENAGEVAWRLLSQGSTCDNLGARQYVLDEKKITFHDLVDWKSEILAAAEALYTRDGQRLDSADIVPVSQITNSFFWQTFQIDT